ncbi:MAG TPA: heparinase II/III family protein, partial [Gemmatimonadaceae bacterium]|nr:heparinase II/III family protein [Gemmatimonadaceae bacterium]
SGVATHLSDGLLADGTWYEGENYHLFAHRGLWYGVQMAERAGLELPRMLVDRLQLGFAAPFASALPDFTLPSRRDSQYAISLRQWRIAEHTELGVARRQDEDLLAALREMYQPDLESRLPRADTRWSSSADVERNGPPSALARSDLSWRALLFALPALPALGSATPRSALLESQGLAVFRRENARIYAALDYGHSGGGHGHPDRLNLLLATRLTRWLDDFGTGSYVDPSLHWYRSTLAHNAPLVDGHSQSPVHGELLAYDERDGAGWIAAAAEEIAPGVSASRTLVVMPDYCVDVVRWDAERDVVVDLPLHADLELVDANAPLEPRALTGGHRTEDGFDFVRDCSVQDVPANAPVVAGARSSDESLRMFASSDRDVEWWRATAPGAPGRGDHVFRILRARGRSGEHRLVWCWGAAVRAVDFKGGIRLTLADGATHRHEASDTGWRVAVVDGATTTVAELAGVVAREPDMPVEPRRERRATAVAVSRTGKPTVVRLGEPHYRRSEESWAAAGEPRATVTFTWQLDGLHITVDVPRSDLTFVAPATVNPYDNEPAGINGDGVQLYVRDSAERQRAWLLVPIAGGDDVAQRAIDGWESEPAPRTHWTRRGLGYSLDITLPGDAPLEIDLAVNEMPRGRVRRRGQLVLGGAEGQFVYLRGDRQDPSRLVRLTLTDA